MMVPPRLPKQRAVSNWPWSRRPASVEQVVVGPAGAHIQRRVGGLVGLLRDRTAVRDASRLVASVTTT